MADDQKRLVISGSILLGVMIAVSQAIFAFVVTDDFPLRITSICVVGLATCLSHLWLIKTVTVNPMAFERVFMMRFVGKLLLYLVCVMGYLFFFKEYGKIFTIHFFFVYIIFAIFDVSLIKKFVKKEKGANS
jgi:hypothetical protein